MIKYLNSLVKFVENENEFLCESKNKVYIIALRHEEVIYGQEGSCNIEFCEENDIPYVHQYRLCNGGCIVGAKGNVFINARCKRGEGEPLLVNLFADAVCEYLIGRGLDSVKQDNNDIMVDGYKVASGCQTYFYGKDFSDEWQYMGYQISINQDLETIEGACNKVMEKEPKGLGEYDITTREIVRFCESYFENFDEDPDDYDSYLETEQKLQLEKETAEILEQIRLEHERQAALIINDLEKNDESSE